MASILYLIPSLRCGGAERAAAVLTERWAKQGHQIVLLTFNSQEEKPFYALYPSVKLRGIGLDSVRGTPVNRLVKNVARIREVRKVVREVSPDCIIASMERANFVALLASVGLSVPVIVTEHGVPFVEDNKNNTELFLRRRLYSRAARVVVLTEEIAEYYRSVMKVPTVVVPNPVLAEASLLEQTEKTNPHEPLRLIAVGRLEKVKGFDLLIEAMKRVVAEFPSVVLHIWGDGPQRDALLAQRDAAGLRDVIHLPGRTDNVLSKLRESDLFVMSSRHEAFPNALLEAQACGLPIVTFACPSGPKVIVRNGIDGIHVKEGDPESLGVAIIHLARHPEVLREMSKHASEVFSRFGLDIVDSLWQSIIKEVTKKS
jgi:GalNAc-alpha-(1->4)-GalNAc-alpha-(1->3)-diNAcBac-PP-undecaprenol alpha-1,4-N-acetyl-D-galactosaminyltransferase